MSHFKKSPPNENLILTEDESLASSINTSVGENSIYINEKSREQVKQADPSSLREHNLEEKWWLKKPESGLAVASGKAVEINIKETFTPSPDVSSSMKEFLEKERMCKELHSNEGKAKEKGRQDTFNDIFASVTFDKYQSDFENATDEDIGSILEEMSKIVGALSPSSGPDQGKSVKCKNIIEEEKSVEELLEEAEELVRKNSTSLSKSASRSETFVPDIISDENESVGRVRQLEADIFQLIEEQVHKETEKIRKSPKTEKMTSSSPGCEIVSENTKYRRSSKSYELQKRKFEEQKIEVSSSSDLDDPIERHSKSEEMQADKKVGQDVDNLQKEITDVDKDFFENLLKKSKERAEGGMSGSSSFGQEDFSHFLRLLQGQADQKELESKKSIKARDFMSKSVDGHLSTAMGDSSNINKTPEFPEKEFSEILEREFSHLNAGTVEINAKLPDSNLGATVTKKSESFSKSKANSIKECDTHKIEKGKSFENDQIFPKRIGAVVDSKKVHNSKSELYTVDLTPRLELFADAIPKLLAEKTSESAKENKKEEKTTSEEITKEIVPTEADVDENFNETKEKLSRDNSVASSQSSSRKHFNPQKSDRTQNIVDQKQQRKENRFNKSRSCDHLAKPFVGLRNHSDSIKPKTVDVSKKPVGTVKKPVTSRLKVQEKSSLKVTPRVTSVPKLKKDPLKVDSTSVTTTKRYGHKSPNGLTKNSMAGGDTKFNEMKHDWEALCQKERQKSTALKQQLESETKMYKTQIESMRKSFEEELFALKKQNIILKAHLDELSLNEKRPEIVQSKSGTQITLLEKELEKQESVIRTYETENKKLLQDVKTMQEEMKSLQQKQKNKVITINETQRLADRVKDLEEEMLRLNLELSELREKNSDYAMKNDDLIQQNGLLTDELEMFKEQLRTKTDFITDRLHAMTTTELDLKKQVEEMNIKLSSKTEQLKIMKMEYEKLQNNILPLEKELLELRVKEGNLQEKLQVARSHVEREKQLTQKLKDQVIVDNKRIMDLNRQVREMERILKRKNPDSVSALILTANSEQDRIGNEKVKLLEERISCLETEIKSQADVAQQKLTELQRKFTEMKDKYIAQIADLEGKLMKANMKESKLCADMFTQTISRSVENKCIEARRDEKTVAFEKEERKDQRCVKVGPKSQNVKEDAHLIATIRGLKFEIMTKDKAMTKLTKELQELQKTNKRLQKEREKLLNDRKSFKTVDYDKGPRSLHSSDSRLTNSKGSEGNDQNSNVYENGHGTDIGSQRLTSSQRLYDPMQYTENCESNTVRRLTSENEILKEELNKMNKDFMALKNKRLHDLNLLQEEHEREMAALVKEYSIKFGDSKVVKLQGQINTQLAAITNLRQQVDKFRDYKEQVTVLQTERDHLENKVKCLTEKIKYLSTPGTEQLQLLQDKITLLQQRHESREITLQNLVRDLLRNRIQCKDCLGEKNSKTRQLCNYRKELDHILGMLQEITDLH